MVLLYNLSIFFAFVTDTKGMAQRNNVRGIEDDVHAVSEDILMLNQDMIILSKYILMLMHKILELHQMLRCL